MSYCKDCGKEIDNDIRFCPNCGAPNTISGNIQTKNSNIQPKSDTEVFNTVKRDGSGLYGSYRLENLPEGFVIDERYEIKSKLGQGGFGAVYLAFDKKMAIDKALKIIPDSIAADEEAMNELHAEARTMVSLNHENIVRVYDVHDTGSIKYIDMEYIDGKALNKIKLESPDKKIPEANVKDIAVKIAKGLSYAHKNKVIHKDIKPQNIMLSENNIVKIMDFGISETVRTSMSRVANSSSSGTLVYMAPEQVKGADLGVEADIYAFGAMLYELLSGHPPFYKGAIEYQIFNEKPADLIDISPELNGIIQKCLEKDSKDRYSTFDEVEAAFQGRMETGSSTSSGTEEKVTTIGTHEIKIPSNKTSVAIKEIATGADGFKKKKSKLPLFMGLGAVVIAAVLSFMFFVLPNLGGSIYADQILLLDKKADTLTVELENLVGKAIEADETNPTIRGLERSLDKKPGNVVALSALSLLYRNLGDYDEELKQLNIIAVNASKGVIVPEVLKFLEKRHSELKKIRDELIALKDKNDWRTVKQLLVKGEESSLLETKFVLEGMIEVQKALLSEALEKKEWYWANSFLNEGAENNLLTESEVKAGAKSMNSGIESECTELIDTEQFYKAKSLLRTWRGLEHCNQEKYSAQLSKLVEAAQIAIKIEIEKALENKDWEKALELLEIGDSEGILDEAYIAENYKKAQDLKEAVNAREAARKAEAAKASTIITPKKIFILGSSVVQYSPRTPISFSINWITDKPEYSVSFLSSLEFSVILDGKKLPSVMNYWSGTVSYGDHDGDGDSDFITKWLYPVGILSDGEHYAKFVAKSTKPIMDGFDLNKDGVLDKYDGVLWENTVQIKIK